MPDPRPSVVELTVDVPDHILVDGRVLCGASAGTDDGDLRVVAAELPVVADASVHRCQECFDRWEKLRDDIDRLPTVRCHCDRLEHGTAYRCGRVVPVNRARRLRHPDAPDGELPVCPDCYEWIKERPGNSVSAPYEDVAPWADARESSRADS